MAAPGEFAQPFAYAPAAAFDGEDFAAPPPGAVAPSCGAPSQNAFASASLLRIEGNRTRANKELKDDFGREGPSYQKLKQLGIPPEVIERMLEPGLTHDDAYFINVFKLLDYMRRRICVSDVVKGLSPSDIKAVFKALGLEAHSKRPAEPTPEILSGFIIAAEREGPGCVHYGGLWFQTGQTVNTFTYNDLDPCYERCANHREPLTLVELVMLNAHSKRTYGALATMINAWEIRYDGNTRPARLQMDTHVACLKLLDEMAAQIRSFRSPERFVLRQYCRFNEDFPGEENLKTIERHYLKKLTEKNVDATPAIVTTVAAMAYWRAWSMRVQERQPWLFPFVEAAYEMLKDPARCFDGCSALRYAAATNGLENWIADTAREKACADDTKACADDTKACADGTKACADDTKACADGTKACADDTKALADVTNALAETGA